LYADQEKYEESEKSDKSAIELNPKDVYVHSNLGGVYGEKKNMKKQKKVIRRL